MSDILWRRLTYMLSPQADIYVSLAPHLLNISVLEVGFGTGFGVLHYADCAREITAIDIDEYAAYFAGTHLRLPNVEWRGCDFLSMGTNRKYDAIIMIEVLEHIPLWNAALALASTLLVSGGKLFVSARNANADLRQNHLHERELTAKQLKDALKEYFPKVTLFDYKLEIEQPDDTRQTPLLAVAVKE